MSLSWNGFGPIADLIIPFYPQILAVCKDVFPTLAQLDSPPIIGGASGKASEISRQRVGPTIPIFSICTSRVLIA